MYNTKIGTGVYNVCKYKILRTWYIATQAYISRAGVVYHSSV